MAKKMDIIMRVSEGELPAFMLYLGVGTLYAMKDRAVSPQTGIWTLAEPYFWEFLKKRRGVPRALIEVFQQADELSAISTAIPDEYDPAIAELIAQLERELAKLKRPIWSVKLSVEPATPEKRLVPRRGASNRKKPKKGRRR